MIVIIQSVFQTLEKMLSFKHFFKVFMNLYADLFAHYPLYEVSSWGAVFRFVQNLKIYLFNGFFPCWLNFFLLQRMSDILGSLRTFLFCHIFRYYVQKLSRNARWSSMYILLFSVRAGIVMTYTLTVHSFIGKKVFP